MKRQGGFSLVELMAVVAIIIVLAGVGTPSLVQMVTNQRIKTTSSDLFTSILRARSEAIKRNTDVAINPAPNWSTGWTIPSPNPGEPALATFVTRSTITVTGPATGLTFTSTGRLKGDANPTFSVTSGQSAARCITVDLSGRPNMQNKSC